MRRPASLFAGLLTLTLALLAGGCSGVQTSLDPAGDEAARIDVVWRTMLVVCGVMYALVLAFLGLAIWRRRSDLGLAPITGRSPAETGMERGLAAWIALILVGLSILVAVSFVIDRALAGSRPEPLLIRVTANQWWWAVEYQDPDPSKTIRTANELHLPVGRSAIVELRSNDVIHSFWIPNLAGKEDLVPGRVNHTTVTPRRVGQFRGQCAEFCGLQHANMALDVTVESPEAFEAWRQASLQPAKAPATPEQATGQAVFLSRPCIMCHRIAGTPAGGVTGPDLTHVASRKTIAAGALPTDEANLASWVQDPRAHKPGTNMPKVTLPPEELKAVAAYLAGLT